MISLENTLFLCHGKKHGIFKEFNLSTSFTLDIDPKTEPDYIGNLFRNDFGLQNFNQNFDNIVISYCPINIFIDNIIHVKYFPVFKNKIYVKRRPIDGTLRDDFFNKVWDLLNMDGHLYMPTYLKTYDGDPNISLLSDKLYKYGFKYETTTYMSYGPALFIVLKKIQKPTYDDIIYFIQKYIESGKVRYITVGSLINNKMIDVRIYTYDKQGLDDFYLNKNRISHSHLSIRTVNDEFIILI